LEAGQEDSIELFASVVPFVFAQLPFATIGSKVVLRLIVSRMDAQQLYRLVGQVLLGDIDMFLLKEPGDDGGGGSGGGGGGGSGGSAEFNAIAPMLKETLEWETYEQVCIWSLLTAELSRHEGNVRCSRHYSSAP
jgi:hypothetical protein